MKKKLQLSDIVVITPIYKATLTEAEQRTVLQGRSVLAAYTRVLVCPMSLDVSAYLTLDVDLQIERFDDSHFQGIKAYNQLMMNPIFYGRFRQYAFMLIYQTDAWVFRDELLEWCEKGYDYIGAPWVAMPPMSKKPIINLSALMVGKVGNGGFCLRSVSNHYYSSLIFRPLSFIFTKNEDFFWCYIMPKLNPFYRIPTASDALPFSFELEPSRCFEQNKYQLPFGCHAWEKYEPAFWKQYF
jgi:hypothetical protein